MKLLILGYSSIVRRRVLAAARSCPWIEAVELASRTLDQRVDAGEPRPAVARTWSDYGEALAASEAELVYVSLVNAAHGPWVRRALASGRHVIVDKPALLGLDEAEAVVDAAARARRVVAEATVWAAHPKLARMIEAVGPGGPVRAAAVFCYPPLPPTNFRWRAELGGGALWDLGPYAVSVGRVLFGREPEALGARILARARGVDTSFCLWADYGDGRGLTGLFGADVAYSNRLELLGEGVRVRADRVFTTPVDAGGEIEVASGAQTRREPGPVADAFAWFFARVGAAIDGGSETLAAELLSDARTLDRVRRSCEEGT